MTEQDLNERFYVACYKRTEVVSGPHGLIQAVRGKRRLDGLHPDCLHVVEEVIKCVNRLRL
jgi:hypothetical protein